MRRIALIDVSSLESLAIRSILEGYPGVHARNFVSLDEIRGTDDSFECFIASVEELLRNLDFFLPRRNRVVAISRETGHSASGFATIGKDTDLTEILTVFDRILNKNNGNDENGELTARETEVLKELVSGLTVKEIADRLCISPSTVITHRKNISSKLGIRSISGLSLYALMNGII